MTDEVNPWISRNPNRKRSAPKTKNNEAVPNNINPSPSTADSSDDNKNNNGIPASLNPFLGWTQLSACHVRRPRNKRRRIQNSTNTGEPLLCVEGKAIFFLHDPRAAENNNKDEEGDTGGDENKPWFQGRFFPSFGLAPNNGGNINNCSRASPTSVVVSSDQQQLLPTSSPLLTSSSWGLLAVQNAIEDECLLDDCGGYRELDLTIIRNKPNNHYRLSRPSSSAAASNNNNNKLRWVVENVEWTGGDMMRLSTDPYSLSSPAASLPKDENGVKFEPKTLMEGKKAMTIASKYFPSLVKRLQIHNLMNEEGEESTSSSSSCDDVMVIVGDMSIVAPKSFVRPQSIAMAGPGDSDEDGLWNDE
eukprot:CAMPEP_0201700522 /NCGR_PEP_ID=MMETSP0578-20130828/28836_1 /ASSEMBLY_ACC=CAM_ASM_000663 /TAXON_ID=267565 /ORGANISM="Skeletonema grethea, Strain CCMP 1804" /LENGTH=360 /DNA_ID=CAMNT_0048187591 /DNA_START=48 /DNA_END=1130 /DNA_ORIENTATION=-